MVPEHIAKLEVFKRAYSAALKIHRMTLHFPDIEQKEMAGQLRRASKSICGNLVEGLGKRQSPRETRRFLIIAIGSCDEVKLWLMFASDLKYISEQIYKEASQDYAEIGKMLYGLKKTNERLLEKTKSAKNLDS
jgi:four helix bundle protein